MRASGLARSVYYYWCQVMKRPEAYEAEKSLIKQVLHAHRGRYGYRRVTLALRRQGCSLNHKTVQKLMGELGLKSWVRPKRYRSYQGEEGRIAPNRLERDFLANRPHQKWVTDVTEFNVGGEKVYLSPVMDLYNQEIVTYEVARTAHLPLVLRMLDKALEQVEDVEGLMVHSDQGWHDQMESYRNRLADRGALVSMSRKGNCLDNAVMENFFGILKSECFHGQRFKNTAALVDTLKDYIRYYNHDRIKAKLKGLSPVEYRTQASSAA